MKLLCTHNVDDLAIADEGISGRLTYARAARSCHWFILVESGKYDDRGAFVPSEPRMAVAFSYVPDATYTYIKAKYANAAEFAFFGLPSDSGLSTLAGYIPLTITQSHVLDTWKLTADYVPLASKPVYQWRFRRLPEFRFYNLCCLIPLFGTSDCIGYCNHQYLNCTAQPLLNMHLEPDAHGLSTFLVVASALGSFVSSAATSACSRALSRLYNAAFTHTR